MNSRMEKYYKEDSVPKRSTRNQDLYKNINEEVDYSSIDINPQTKTINLEELRKMLDTREIRKEVVQKKDIIEEVEDEKNYDLNYVLNQARSNKVDDDKKRSISNTQYNILKTIDLKNNPTMDLKDLIDTITTKNLVNEDKDLFDDLKSNDNTVVGVPSDLNEIFKESNDDTRVMDETFFTKSMKLDPKDFETINTSLEKNNKMMKIIFIMIIAVIIIILGIIVVMVI